jgi:hypothetical protein
MSKALDALGAIGSVVSIVGAWIAYRQAQRATTAREAAEAARDALVERRAVINVAALHAKGRSTQEFTRQMAGPARAARGFDHAGSILAVQEFIDALSEHSHHLSVAGIQANLPEDLAEMRTLVDELTPLTAKTWSRKSATRLNELVARWVAVAGRRLDAAPIESRAD